MKKILILMLALFLLPSILAVNLDVKRLSENEVLILDLNEPTTFNLSVTNNGPTDRFLFYTFFGGGLDPTERIQINQGETKNIQLTVYPRESHIKGLNSVVVYIQGKDSSETEVKLPLNIVELEDVFEIGSGEIDPTSNTMEFYIKNKVNYNFKGIEAEFSSPFFEQSQSFDLAPFQQKTFTVNLEKEQFNELMAGFYTLKADISVYSQEAKIEGNIRFVEKDIVLTEKKDYGLIVNTKVIEKENQGNLIADTETIIKKSIISRLFTTFSPEPDVIDRQGFTVYYTWNEELAPGEKFSITVRTNWLLPFLIILLIVAIVVLTKKYSKNYLNLRKRVSFVRTKGGEFALKVTIIAEARQFAENIRLSDTLPPLVKLYNRFTGPEPDKMSKRRIEWDLGNLEPGERRVLSYILYSKVGVLGRFALSPAIARYEKDGKQKQTSSNRAFFVTQPSKKEDEFD
jgi:hypothetical protein